MGVPFWGRHLHRRFLNLLLQIFKLGFRDATVCYGLYLGIRKSTPDTFLTF